MKEIQLTKGQNTLVDDDDFEFLNQWRWHCQTTPDGHNYAMNRRAGLMHRLIMNVISKDKGIYIDHINHHTLDNRKSNLRICTQTQNTRNRLPQKDGRSKFKGVCWHKIGKKWMTRIRTGEKYLYLGLYSDEKEAAIAYNEAAKKYHGEFAYLNQVD